MAVDRAQKLRQRTKFKGLAVEAYGGRCAEPECAAPFDDLTIDHVDGRGAEHSAEHKIRNSLQFHRWLAQRGYPTGFQVLCRGCNARKGRKSAEASSAPRCQLTLFVQDPPSHQKWHQRANAWSFPSLP